MNFMEAVKLRCEGNTIVSEDDKYKLEGTGSNIEIWDFEICDFKKLNKYIVDLNWKIFEEKKTLSDNIFHMGGTSGREDVLDIMDVKDSLKEFLDWGKERFASPNQVVEQKAKEIFGEKLTGGAKTLKVSKADFYNSC